MAGFSNEVVYGSNVDFSGSTTIAPRLNTNGQMLIGSTVLNAGGTTINVGTLVSPDNSLTIGYSNPNITLQVNPVIPPFGVTNLGCTLSAGVFTITSANGTALSATNYATVWIPSKLNPGHVIRYTITANQSFQDHNGTSTIAGASWGVNLDQNVTYDFDMPFFLYAVCDSTETTISFMMSRIPHITISPVAGKIGKTGSTAAASTQGSMFAFANPTVANYASNPCICIGSIRMQSTQRTTAGIGIPPDWIVQTLNGSDGITRFQEQTFFNLKLGSFGASANSFWAANGGTAPTSNTATTGYSINRSGDLLISPAFINLSASGVGVVTSQFCIPYNMIIDTNCSGFAILDAANNTFVIAGTCMNGTNIITFYNVNSTLEGPMANTSWVTGHANAMTTSLTGKILNS